MHRRFLFPLAAGVVGLVAISPALAASPSPSGAKGTPAKATTTSSGKGPTSSTTAGSRPGTGSQTGSTTDTSGGGTDSTATTDTTGMTDTTGSTDTSGPTGTTATTAPGGRSGSTATTSPASGTGGGAGSSSSTCGAPATDQGPAPQMGEAPQNHGAGDAGSVDVERLSPTELRIAKATANSGWVEQVTAPSGPRVTVKFQRSGQSPTLIRFAASMDQAGRIIHTRVTSCG
jgi:hypothetical protein